MHCRNLITIILCVFYCGGSMAQPGCILGQDPATAFPVCGTDVFEQNEVPVCGGRSIPTQTCNGLFDLNPFWYRFKCFKSGSLALEINPKNAGDDYDWQLFDITNRDPNDLYTDISMGVAANWSGITGNTGASINGTSLFVCETPPTQEYRNPYSSMPGIIEGHEYILLVSHFFGSDQSGYSLSFNGGTSSITDPKEPGLEKARAICDGVKITVKLNKKMKCSSLNAGGSDFLLTPAISPIIAAEGINCSNGFDMDSILLTLVGPIPPGKYQIAVKDGNLLDNCDRTIPAGQSYPIEVFPLFPTPMDSITAPGCAPQVLQLVFKDPIRCSSIAADGSDFTITTGGTSVAVSNAAANCGTGGLTNIIDVTLSAPMQVKGLHRITLTVGRDGNSIINECGKETPAGQFVFFTTKDTVSAVFAYKVLMGCIKDTVQYFHDGRNDVNYWQWTFDKAISSAKDTSIIYPISVSQSAALIVSNGLCSDTAAAVISLNNAFTAAMMASDYVCPNEAAVFKDNSSGQFIRGWNWDMGDGKTSTQQNPPTQFYAAPVFTKDYTIRLIVTDSIGCTDTAFNKIKVLNSCYIAVPKAFTPNSDSRNDFLFPTNAYKARDLYFAVYNRVGQKIFETTNWLSKWDGSFKGNPQDPGTYIWYLRYTHSKTGERFNLKGTTVLLR